MDKVRKVEPLLYITLLIVAIYFVITFHYDRFTGEIFYFSFKSFKPFFFIFQVLVRFLHLFLGIYTLKIVGILFTLGIVILIYVKHKNYVLLLFFAAFVLFIPFYFRFFMVFSPHLFAIFLFLLYDYLPNVLKVILCIVSFFIAPYLPLTLLLKIKNKKILYFFIPLLIIYYFYFFLTNTLTFEKNYWSFIYSLIFIPIIYIVLFIKKYKKYILPIIVIFIVFLFFPQKDMNIAPIFIFILLYDIIFNRVILRYSFLIIIILSLFSALFVKNLYRKFAPLDNTFIMYKNLKKVPVLTDSTVLSKELYITQINNKSKKTLFSSTLIKNDFIAYKYIIMDKFILEKYENVPDALRFFFPLFDFKEIVIYKNSGYDVFKTFANYINNHIIDQSVIVDNSIYPLIESDNKISLNDFLTNYKNTNPMLKAKYLLIPDYMLENPPKRSLLQHIKERLNIEQWKVVISKGGYTLYQSPYTK